eukprot:CAMPEP_0203750932 /NCGR_PEP_ID=MMETSP0098-20131031/5086_1 /ASSEMBLY_ACC=CAM_ASM_000208 /TAXON_ID=96639 /ORGANISM=" , Strain NY0313808BC1" /LENGTH=253 /DNA_ID=CAMNT_0050640443 /DNA_START=478 /DNA_END=1239 /DNA_ORIENTATION=-
MSARMGRIRQGWKSQDKIDSELPSPGDAQKMQLYVKRKLLSSGEVKEVVDFERQHKGSCGHTRRDAQGFRKMDSTWQTSYLHTNHLMQKYKPEIVDKLVAAAFEADLQQGWGLLNGDKDDFRIRVIELHSVGVDGALADEKHFDQGSLVTVDVMMCPATQFEGGQLSTLETDGQLAQHQFDLGDAVVFPSHKYHCVLPVEQGSRSVLVMEIWRGEERDCAHRCLQHIGSCNHSLAQNRMETFFLSAMPEVDPW